jgi:formate C-acetyltransferase
MNVATQTASAGTPSALAASKVGRPAPTGRAGLKRLINLLDYYFARGGMQLQFNVVSRATLEAAQRDPDKYRSLIVRVAGYSAYFVGLDKTVQQDIIERTEERLQ